MYQRIIPLMSPRVSLLPDHWNDNFNRLTLGTNWTAAPANGGVSSVPDGSKLIWDIGTINDYSNLTGVGTFDMRGKTVTMVCPHQPNNAVGFRDYMFAIYTASNSNSLNIFGGGNLFLFRVYTGGVHDGNFFSGNNPDDTDGLRISHSGTTVVFSSRNRTNGGWVTGRTATITFTADLALSQVRMYNGRYGGSVTTPHDNWEIDSILTT